MGWEQEAEQASDNEHPEKAAAEKEDAEKQAADNELMMRYAFMAYLRFLSVCLCIQKN